MPIFANTPYDYENFVDQSVSREVYRITQQAIEKYPDTVLVQILGNYDSFFQTGQVVYVKTPNYDFSGAPWYIYKGAGFYNLYIRTPYKGEDTGGVVSKKPIISEQQKQEAGILPIISEQQKQEAGILPSNKLLKYALIAIGLFIGIKILKKGK